MLLSGENLPWRKAGLVNLVNFGEDSDVVSSPKFTKFTAQRV